MDWRIWVIVGAYALTAAVIVFIYYTEVWGEPGSDFENPGTHVGAIFAGLVAGFILSIVVGATAAVVQSVRPDQESFDARARILFRRQTGEHVDYIVARIKSVLEHYAESTLVRTTILDYDSAEKKFHLSVYSKSTIRSYLDDVPTTYVSGIKYTEVTQPPAGRKPNRLVYVRVNGDIVVHGVDFTDQIDRPFTTEVGAYSACEIETLIEFWSCAEGEENVQICRRFIQFVIGEFENLLAVPVSVKLLTGEGATATTVVLRPGERKKAVELKNVEPSVHMWDFRPLSP